MSDVTYSRVVWSYWKEMIFSKPFEIHAEITVGDKRTDLILGRSEVGVEIKHLRKHTSVPTFQNIKKEAAKVANYVAKELFKHAFLAIVDERGTARRGLRPISDGFNSWKTVKTEQRNVTFALCALIP